MVSDSPTYQQPPPKSGVADWLVPLLAGVVSAATPGLGRGVNAGMGLWGMMQDRKQARDRAGIEQQRLGLEDRRVTLGERQVSNEEKNRRGTTDAVHRAASILAPDAGLSTVGPLTRQDPSSAPGYATSEILQGPQAARQPSADTRRIGAYDALAEGDPEIAQRGLQSWMQESQRGENAIVENENRGAVVRRNKVAATDEEIRGARARSDIGVGAYMQERNADVVAHRRKNEIDEAAKPAPRAATTSTPRSAALKIEGDPERGYTIRDPRSGIVADGIETLDEAKAKKIELEGGTPPERKQVRGVTASPNAIAFLSKYGITD